MTSGMRSAVVGFVAGAAGAALVLITSIPGVQLFGDLAPTRSEKPDTAIDTGTSVPADSYEAAVIATVKRVSPAVVSVVITKDVPVIEQFFQEIPGSPFGSFGPFQFRIPSLRQQGTERREVGGGSGFIISADGMIITNRHVVADESAEYTVFTNSGDKHTARVIARDTVNDVAVLKIDVTNSPFLTFGNSDQLQVGQTAIAIGNALSEFENTVSVGVISGLSRSIVAGDNQGQAEQLEEVIQTDAAINPGNSGGPLLNLAGEVIGVNVAVALGSENIGFALPGNVVKDIVETVQKTGRIVRPFIGVRYVMVNPVIKEQNSLPVDHGALIIGETATNEPAVVPGSPAAKAGLREGDVIVRVDGTELTEKNNLAGVIRNKNVGDSVQIQILRDGKEQTFTLTLEEGP